MEVEARSSSIDLSSAPSSDTERPNFDFTASPKLPTSSSHVSGRHTSGESHKINDAASSGNAATGTVSRQDPPKQRRPRKPRDPFAAASDASKPKVPRKPRAASGTAAASKRKPKAENIENQPPLQNIPGTADLQSSRLVEPYTFPAPPNAQPTLDEAAKYSQNGLSKQDSSMQAPNQPPPSYSANNVLPSKPQPHSARSSAIYDPVRSITTQRLPDPPQASLTLSGSTNVTPPRPISRSGASPLSSLIDGPMPGYPAAPSPLRTFVTPTDSHVQPPRVVNSNTLNVAPGAMEIDAVPTGDTAPQKVSVSKKTSSEAPTRAPSPKPTRAKEKSPPLPTGSGLLSASLFGGEIGAASGKDATVKGANIVLHIDLKDPNNKVINFARLAEEKYGFDALYPRQAAQRKRLNEIAARGAALERSASGSKVNSAGESGDDDGSVDIDKDSDNDGDVAMSGVNGIDQMNSGTDGPEPVRKRRKKVEDYDQEDPFVDDSEQIWEQQAATSKDGFFVYCGPLVPEGEKPAVERADGTINKRGGRGRGRGGGPGSRGGRGARAAAAAREGINATGDSSRPTHGPGSRGGATTRKPRMRKGDRAQVEQEKAAREKTAPLAAKPEAKPEATALG